jgi:hypothetical protein
MIAADVSGTLCQRKRVCVCFGVPAIIFCCSGCCCGSSTRGVGLVLHIEHLLYTPINALCLATHVKNKIVAFFFWVYSVLICW